MRVHVDVAVLGAGPAGVNAALATRRAGLSTLVIDEAAAAGGQVWGQPMASRAKPSPDGERLRDQLASCGAQLALGQSLWFAEPGYTLHLMSGQGHRIVEADRVILANGAHERVIPFPGWTLPGVIGLAGATILMKAHGTLPGKRTLIVGHGPLLAAVAKSIIDLGGEVAGILDGKSSMDWLKALPALRHRPAVLSAGLSWWLEIKRQKIPWRANSHIESITADGQQLVVTVARSGEPIVCDAVAIGDGLTPSSEIPRLLGADMVYDEPLGGWVPRLDEMGRCSQPGLYACGDGTGIRGAAVAEIAGELAGLALANDAGALPAARFEQDAAQLTRKIARFAKSASAMAALMSPEPGRWQTIAPETTICRCEDVTRSMLERAIDEGAREIDQLKAWTRCGMGPCQGRMCGEAAARLLAQATGQEREAIKPWTARLPLRPVPMADLLGAFDYADIPIPDPAPL